MASAKCFSPACYVTKTLIIKKPKEHLVWLRHADNSRNFDPRRRRETNVETSLGNPPKKLFRGTSPKEPQQTNMSLCPKTFTMAEGQKAGKQQKNGKTVRCLDDQPACLPAHGGPAQLVKIVLVWQALPGLNCPVPRAYIQHPSIGMAVGFLISCKGSSFHFS